MRLTLAVLFLAFHLSFSAIPTDIVKNLPLIPPNLNFTIYSGYLATSDPLKNFHYVLLTKTGELSTVNDAPLILWLNGGPGCSSLDGLFIENGPFVFEDGQEKLNGTFNIWSWNNLANVLYIESPAGVGFSTVGPNGTTWDDPTTTQDNYDALVSFFKGYPEFLDTPFWIAGESYGGIYVPWLGAKISEENQGQSSIFINLQGIMVGNGVASYTNTFFTEIDFYYGHYLIPDDLYSQVYQACQQNMNSDPCNDAMNQVNNLVALLNPYDIYRYCYTKSDTASRKGWLFSRYLPFMSHHLKNAGIPVKANVGETSDTSDSSDEDIPCIFTAGIENYVNDPAVKKALNVDVNVHWSLCSSSINYNPDPSGSVPKYLELMAQNYKILVYSGDTDSVVPYTTTLAWIENLGLPVVEDWRPWYEGDQVQGFVEVYNGLTYVTVKGVGHQVPAWKRQEAYTMVSSFVTGQEMPRKSVSSTTKKSKTVSIEL